MTVSRKIKHLPIARYILMLGMWAIVLSSCTPVRKLAYFQSAGPTDDTLTVSDPYVPTIRKGDVLSIQVSSLNAEASGYFNPAAATDNNSSAATANNPLARQTGYLVAPDGTIKLPLIGQLTVEGLTNTKASDLIATKLKIYLKEPTVIVRNTNFRISVLGEVTRPSLFTIPNEQITLPEALGLAGDLTIYGRRDNVLVVREEGNKKVFVRLDLTHRDAFRSPYYSLRPNDIVYVEPGKARATSVDRVYLIAPLITGILSIIAIIATRP